MLDGQQTTLRARLRQDTTENHARVDALFSTLDLAEPVSLARFLAAHRAGFAAMLLVKPEKDGLVVQTMLAEMVAALDLDLASLGASAPRITAEPVCQEALDHIVLGSRLGTAVLKRHWAAGTHPKVRAAGHYFSLPGRAAHWRAHTDHLKTLSAFGPEADRIIADTQQLYRLFERAFHDAE